MIPRVLVGCYDESDNIDFVRDQLNDAIDRRQDAKTKAECDQADLDWDRASKDLLDAEQELSDCRAGIEGPDMPFPDFEEVK